jgi:L,D-peptidoglycan transpeptidase YkuD (ErfK/YbiS/YcfS/YnhG family)
MEPNVSGDAPGEIPFASAIFLHAFSFDANGKPKATSGCISLGRMNLIKVLTAMEANTMFAIGESSWLLANT